MVCSRGSRSQVTGTRRGADMIVEVMACGLTAGCIIVSNRIGYWDGRYDGLTEGRDRAVKALLRSMETVRLRRDHAQKGYSQWPTNT